MKNKEINIDTIKLNKYNEHIKKLENLLKSVEISGKYEKYKLVPNFMLFNFIDLLRGVGILDYNHMVVSCRIIIRTMFELLVDFLYCETKRKDLYERFISFQYVNRVLLYNSIGDDLQSQIDMDTFKKITLPKYNQFLQKYDISCDNTKELLNWSGKSLIKRVNIVSQKIPEILKLYFNIYKVNCDYTHTYVDTISKYAIFDNGNINLNYNQLYEDDKYGVIHQINSLVSLFYDSFNNVYSNKKLEDVKF